MAEDTVESIEVGLVLHQARAAEIVEVVDRITGDSLRHRLQKRQVLAQAHGHARLPQLKEEVHEHGPLIPSVRVRAPLVPRLRRYAAASSSGCAGPAAGTESRYRTCSMPTPAPSSRPR